MKPITLLSLFFLSISILPAQNKAEDPRLKGLDKELEQMLEDFHVAGFGVAIVDKDQMIYAKGFGYRDYEKKLPATENTLFAIGSCSKAFTSSLLGQFAEEDRIDFDKSPIDYLPQLRFYNDEMNQQITIRDMMCHRTGLPRHDISWYLFPSDSKMELMKRIAHQEPSAAVRQTWQYNNFMFMTQGLLAEALTQKSWSDNVKEQIFSPLGMSQSNFTIEALEASTEPSLGYDVDEKDQIEKMDYYKIRAMSPAGSINSSVQEMGNWLITWINGGTFQDNEVLPASYVREAMSSQMVVDDGLPNTEHPDVQFATYGFGWMMSSYRGHYRVAHGGNIDGFSAMTCFFPSDSIGVVVLANQNGSNVPSLVRNMVADRMLGLDRVDWVEDVLEQIAKIEEAKEEESTEEEEDSPTDQIKGTSPSHPLADYEGIYAHPGYGEMEIKQSNDSLFATLPEKELWLRHYHYDIFEPVFAEDIGEDDPGQYGFRFNFASRSNGDIKSVSIPLEGTLDPIEFMRKPKAKELALSVLQSYEGDYELEGMSIKIFLKNENVLYAYVPGQPEYELLATDMHKFNFKVLDGFRIEFVEAEEQSIGELILYQPNGTFKAQKK